MCWVFTWIMRKVQSMKTVKITKRPRLNLLQLRAVGETEAGEAWESEVRLTQRGDKEATEVKRPEAGQR